MKQQLSASSRASGRVSRSSERILRYPGGEERRIIYPVVLEEAPLENEPIYNELLPSRKGSGSVEDEKGGLGYILASIAIPQLTVVGPDYCP